MRGLLLWSLTIASFPSQAQLTQQLLTVLDTSLAENSGLLYVGGAVWTHTDGGGPAALMQVDPSTGQVTRTVAFSNATNVDWEDVTTDGTHVYVGDFGNNSGSRTDLRIFRFPLDSLLDPTVQTVMVDTIAFNYADQTDFTPTQFSTNWDMEAMIALDDTLFLFSRNWGNQETYLYALPSTPGQHTLTARDTLDAQGLISGADIDPATGRIVLTGLEITLPFVPFIWTLNEYPGHDLFGGWNNRLLLTVTGIQLEGVAFRTPDTLYLSNETFQTSPARLWELSLALPTVLGTLEESPEPVLAAYPWGWTLHVPGTGSALVQVLDGSGRLVLQRQIGENGTLSLQRSELPSGALVVNITGSSYRTTGWIINR